MKVPFVQAALPGVQAAGRAIGVIRSLANTGLPLAQSTSWFSAIRFPKTDQ
jgi:hypothetical protein